MGSTTKTLTICHKCGRRDWITFPSRNCDVCTKALFLPQLSPSRIPLTIVCGPSGSGKSTWVRSIAKPRDIVIDLDDIKQELTKQPIYSNFDFCESAFLRRNDMLDSLRFACEVPNVHVYFIVQSADIVERQHWRRVLQPQEVVVFEVDAVTCLQRIADDPRRGHQLAHWVRVVGHWWERYRRDPQDTIFVGVTL